MNLPPPKICQLASKLFAQMGSSRKDADVAHEKLRKLLEEHGLTWNDLPRILGADTDVTGTAGDAGTCDPAPAANQPTADDNWDWSWRCSKNMLAPQPNSAWRLRCGLCIVGCSISLSLHRGSRCSLL
jgi:hypothetical protein